MLVVIKAILYEGAVALICYQQCVGNQCRSTLTKLGIERVLANISRSRYVAIATQPAAQLQILPIVHNQGASPTTPASYIQVLAILQ